MFDTKQTFEEDLRAVARFEIGLRHELFFALQVATDPGARLHPAWRAEIAGALAEGPFAEAFARLGSADGLWVLLPDAFEPGFVGPALDDVLFALERVEVSALQRRLFEGVLHDEAVVEAILAGHRDVPGAIRTLPAARREWLAFVGLYPPDPTAPLVRALERLRTDPEGFRGDVLVAVRAFWAAGFGRTWEVARPALERALAERERLFAACSFEEFAQRALLRVEVDRPTRSIRAVRGGYALPVDRLAAAVFTPSMFNDRRHWAAYEGDGGVVAHFPMFEWSVGPDVAHPEGGARSPAVQDPEPALDPALVFRALGDATRFAVATLLAAEPRTAADLCRVLGVSRPTMSHHVHEMREAGLLDEERSGASVRLSLRRSVLEGLSAATVTRLYHPHGPPGPMPTTRRNR